MPTIMPKFSHPALAYLDTEPFIHELRGLLADTRLKYLQANANTPRRAVLYLGRDEYLRFACWANRIAYERVDPPEEGCNSPNMLDGFSVFVVNTPKHIHAVME